MTIALPKSVLSNIPRLGELWPEQGGHLGGIMRGSEFDYLLIVPTDEAARMKSVAYGEYGVDHGAYSDWDGEVNTVAMSQAGSKLALDILALGGDLYLPARKEARMLSIIVPELFETDDWYWTSTQYSAYYAYVQYFDGGLQSSFDKNGKARVQLVRRLILQ